MATVLSIVAIAYEADKSNTVAASKKPHLVTKATNALPFLIESVSLSDLFVNDLKVARVNVGVNGGTASEWAATAVTIAQKVAGFGADSIELSVLRNEIFQAQGVRFREVAHAYYSPVPTHTVWEGDPAWQVYVADPSHLATQQDVNIDKDFTALNQRLIDKGMDFDVADKRAGAIIAKKYKLQKDWTLPAGNISTSGGGVDLKSLTIDSLPAVDSLRALEQCMGGKIIRMLTPC